jgi:hypothetical protein
VITSFRRFVSNEGITAFFFATMKENIYYDGEEKITTYQGTGINF